jgi:aryl-alcohol dehydrogenase-like predicted oxidoreductase
MIEKREIGRSGLKIAPLVLGGNVFGWNVDRTTAFQILDRFVDAGFDALDTADIYSAWVPGHTGGESEAIIGEWFLARGNRGRVILATKVGGIVEGRSSFRACLSTSEIMAKVEGSLARLRTDYIDLCQSHLDDSETPLEETLEAYDRLIQAGKVRAIGASNYTEKRLAESLRESQAKGLPCYVSIQPRYNLLERSEFEGPLQELCVAQEVGALCYSALAKGFLTGKFRDPSSTAGTIWSKNLEPYFDGRGLRVLAALEIVARKQTASMAAVALAWLMAQRGVTAPIVAASTVEELDEIMSAARLRLSDEDIAALAEAGAT